MSARLESVCATLGPPVGKRRALRWRAPKLAWLLCLLLAAPAFSGTWHRFSTEEFDVIGDASLKEMRRAAVDIQTYRFVMQKILPALAKPSLVRPKLFIVSHDTFRTFLLPGNREVAGLTAPRPFSLDIMVDANASDWLSTSTILEHELTHYYLRANLTTLLPAWFDEGIAEFLSTIGRKRDLATVGAPSALRWTVLQSLPWMPLETFIGLDVDPDRSMGQEGAAFYAQAWLLMHYSFLGDAQQFNRIMKVLALQDRGYSATVALHSVFGESLPQFEKSLRDYAAKRSYRMAQMAIPAMSAESAAVIEMTPAEGYAELALLLLRLQRNPKQVADALVGTGALADDRIVAARALHASRSAARDAAQLREQCRAAATSAAGLMICGEAYLNTKDTGSDGFPVLGDVDSAEAKVALGLYERVLALQPDNAEALFFLAQCYRLTGQNADNLLPLLQQVRADTPAANMLRMQVAALYMAHGELEEAKAEIEKIAATSNDRGQRAWSIRTLQSLDTEIADRDAMKPSQPAPPLRPAARPRGKRPHQ